MSYYMPSCKYNYENIASKNSINVGLETKVQYRETYILETRIFYQVKLLVHRLTQ